MQVRAGLEVGRGGKAGTSLHRCTSASPRVDLQLVRLHGARAEKSRNE